MADQKNRRLAAIMFTDIAGYSAMMHRNEVEGREMAMRYRKTLERYVSEYGGEILHHYGDGSLSIFSSAVESIRCAKAIQLSLQEEPKVPLRVGIHVGDIVKEGEDVYGDGVNIASRVESLGVPGSVLLTERVVFEIKSHPDLKVAGLGKFAFKNIDDPIEVYALADEGLVIPNPESLQGKAELLRREKRYSLTRFKPRFWHLGPAILLLFVLSLGYQGLKKQQQKRWVFQTALPEIERLSESLTYSSPNNGFGPAAWEAFALTKKSQSYSPRQSRVKQLTKANFTSGQFIFLPSGGRSVCEALYKC